MKSVQNSVCLRVINGWIVETVDGIDKHFFVVGKIDLSVLSEFSAVMHELRINKPKTSGFNGNRLTVFVMGVKQFRREKGTAFSLRIILITSKVYMIFFTII